MTQPVGRMRPAFARVRSVRLPAHATAAGAAATLVALVAACASTGGVPSATGGSSGAATSSGEISIGLMADLTGGSSLFGPPTEDAGELAVEQINAAGGIDGKKVNLIFLDSASSVTQAKQDAQRLVQQDHVSALFGMFSSAEREAALPVAQQAGVPFFYAPVWEGGTCDPDLFANGEVPSQQLGPVIPWVQQQTGKTKWYLLGDDYVWPHASFTQAEKYIKAAGGQIVGVDYVPLGTTDFTAAINKIRASGANIMIPALVGADAVAFEKQAYASGLGNSQVQRLAILYEDNTRAAMGAQVTAGMYFSTGYDKVISGTANAAFLSAYAKMFGAGAPVQTTLSEHAYAAIESWAKAASAAKTTGLAAITKAIAGLTVSTPGGPVTWGNHYAAQTIYLDQIQPDGRAEIVKTFPDVSPDQAC